MSSDSLQFWFEFGSTYSHLSAARIEKVAGDAGVRVEWKPFLLGPIFRAQGWNDSPFNIYPVKGRYMWRDMERLCAKLEIPFRKPTQFPRNGLLAARIACAALEQPWISHFVRLVYHANFAEDRDISQPQVLGDVLAAIGTSAEPWIERAHSPESKARLRQHTEEAVQKGIFGAPTFSAREEIFWGNDRLEDAIAWCQRGG
jgi:2-hydroxychromene-2-carboxylate isomerase